MYIVKKYKVSFWLGMLSAFSIASIAMLSSLFILIASGFIRKVIEKYIQSLIKQQANNGLLMLFPQDIGRILNNRYLFEYTRNLFMVLGIMATVFILSTVVMLIANYHSLRRNNGRVGEQLTRHQLAVFTLIFASTILLIAVSLFVITVNVFKSNVAEVLILYLDSTVVHNGRNPFVEVFKGIIRETFGLSVVDDIILQSRSAAMFVLSLAISISVLLILLSGIFLVLPPVTEVNEIEGNTEVNCFEALSV